MKHLLKLEDWSTEEIVHSLNLADQLKYEQKHGIEHKLLKGKTLGMIFEKSSTRTRVSFEVGMTQLGGYPLFLSSNDLQIGRGEPVQDTARVLSRFIDAIMIRTFEQSEVEALAEYGSIPIINGLTDYCHPCQVLAGALRTGMSFSAACPEGYMPPEHILEFGKSFGDKFEIVHDPKEAAKNADVVYTDVWASMGQEEEKKIREAAFEGYQVNDDLMSITNEGCMVLHCLPAHRGEEITAEVFEAHADEIFEEAENRLHAQKAVLVECLIDKKEEEITP